MPKINGFEFLHWLRCQSDYPHIPVVVLTLSDEIRDIQKAYQNGANSFLVKPPNVADLREIVKMIDTYWARLNKTTPFSPSLETRWIEPKPFGTQN